MVFCNYTFHIPEDTIQKIEHIVYNFLWSKKAHLTNKDVLALPLLAGGFNIHRIRTKITALRLNTLRRRLDTTSAHWKTFAEFFLRTSNMNVGKMTLVQEYETNEIDRTVPKFHKELLVAWYEHNTFRNRIGLPTCTSTTCILNEPIFRNPIITDQDNKTLLYKDWVNAAITNIRDICYEVIPGFLRWNAVHEILPEIKEENENRTKQQTKQEFDTIKCAIPTDWKYELEKSKDNTERLASQSTQPRFEVNSQQGNQTTKEITELKTTHFYRQLMHDKNTTIPALEYWRANLQPTPTFDSNHWKSTYSKLITKKQGDVNWKLV